MPYPIQRKLRHRDIIYGLFPHWNILEETVFFSTISANHCFLKQSLKFPKSLFLVKFYLGCKKHWKLLPDKAWNFSISKTTHFCKPLSNKHGSPSFSSKSVPEKLRYLLFVIKMNILLEFCPPPNPFDTGCLKIGKKCYVGSPANRYDENPFYESFPKW